MDVTSINTVLVANISQYDIRDVNTTSPWMFPNQIRFDILSNSDPVVLEIVHANLEFTHLGERDLCIYDAVCYGDLNEANDIRRTDLMNYVVADEAPYKVK